MRQESKEEKEEKGKQRAGSRGEAEELQEWKSEVGRELDGDNGTKPNWVIVARVGR